MLASRHCFTDKQYPLAGSICDHRIFDSMPLFFTTKMLSLLLIVLVSEMLSFSGINCYIFIIFNGLRKFIHIFKMLFWQDLQCFVGSFQNGNKFHDILVCFGRTHPKNEA